VETKAATVVLIPHNNLERARLRLGRDVAPTLRHHADWRFELLVLDNSERRLDGLAQDLAALPWPSRYLWHEGQNLLYGPAMNRAAVLAQHPVMVYVCTNHGRMFDPTWIDDLVRPFWEDDRVAMTGHLYPGGDPKTLGLSYRGPWVHVQGGVLAIRTDIVRSLPYDEGMFAHGCSDIFASYRAAQAGYVLKQVPSVISVWRQVAPPGRWKYVHDDSEG
jgi:GT2 family glycosyltransferase